MSIDPDGRSALQLGLLPMAERARSDLSGIRRDIGGLEPADWHSPAARLAADILQELRDQLAVAEAVLDDAMRMLGSGS